MIRDPIDRALDDRILYFMEQNKRLRDVIEALDEEVYNQVMDRLLKSSLNDTQVDLEDIIEDINDVKLSSG